MKWRADKPSAVDSDDSLRYQKTFMCDMDASSDSMSTASDDSVVTKHVAARKHVHSTRSTMIRIGGVRIRIPHVPLILSLLLLFSSSFSLYLLLTRPPVQQPHIRSIAVDYAIYDPRVRPFPVLLHPTIEEGTNPTRLLVVHSAVHHSEKRDVIRKTYGRTAYFEKMSWRLVFVLGRSVNASDEETVTEEYSLHGDILQSDFVDHYENITIKAFSWIRYINAHLPSVRQVFKTDDDIFVNMAALDRMVQVENVFSTPRSVACYMWHDVRVQRDGGKWELSRAEYPLDHFPPYCSGGAFFVTTDILPAIEQMFTMSTYLFVDDFYLTGHFARLVGASFIPLNRYYSMYAAGGSGSLSTRDIVRGRGAFAYDVADNEARLRLFGEALRARPF